ncbi:MAG TPA: hypothetical protein VJH75_03595 [Patescibacteria group bacterium]|nr:hypothetical protein [Patescibacteria group bacterium]
MFSSLQQYILKECSEGGKTERKNFGRFYGPDSKVKKTDRVKIITQSLERLMDRGYLIGYGIRTPKKWFIKEVKITREGIKQWNKYLSRRQKKLPF